MCGPNKYSSIVQAITQSEVLTKSCKTQAKNVANIRFFLRIFNFPGNGRKMLHEKSSPFFTVRQIKFFHCCNSGSWGAQLVGHTDKGRCRWTRIKGFQRGVFVRGEISIIGVVCAPVGKNAKLIIATGARDFPSQNPPLWKPPTEGDGGKGTSKTMWRQCFQQMSRHIATTSTKDDTCRHSLHASLEKL